MPTALMLRCHLPPYAPSVQPPYALLMLPSCRLKHKTNYAISRTNSNQKKRIFAHPLIL